MNGINTFQDRLEALIAHAKANTSISHMTDEEGNPASWDSKVWVYTNDNHQTANLLFTSESKSGAKLSFYKKAEPLPSPLREVVMLFALQVIGKDIDNKGKRNRVAIAREILASVNDIENLSHQRLKTLCKDKSTTFKQWVNDFINFLNDSLFQHDPLRKLKITKTAKTGDETEMAEKDKLPDEKCIAALGAITYDTISPQKALWETGPLESQRDAFACTMSALAMGAPNRVAAEQTVLDTQRLQKHTAIKNGKEEVVHYLNWKGSKGYKNNQNHILSVVSECVERCLDYMLKATQPMRILSRCYAEPTLPLKSILRKQDCDAKRWQRVMPNLNKPTNMVTLGYLLGLYDEGATIQVVKGTEGAFSENPHVYNSAWHKPVWAIKSDDVFQMTHSSVGDFIGLKHVQNNNRKELLTALGMSGPVPLKEVQAAWISHIKKAYPGFPEMRNHTTKGVFDARTMLFALSGRQLGVTGGASKSGAGSSFFPVAPSTLGLIYSDEITYLKYRPDTIFTRHGFSPEFSILPHQFRHYLNHTGFERGVPKLILNLWSGREDPTQVLHYIHTSDADQASMISDIMFNEAHLDVEQAKTHIRLISHQEHQELTSTVASVTSSGLCTQPLYVIPCEYLNDFDTQCVFCAKSCHVAHDDEAIALLNKDLHHQQQRLEEVADSPQFAVSKASQEWYKLHSQQIAMLTQLLALMNDKAIREGSLIRLLSAQRQFRITDLQTKQVEIKQLCLPDIDNEIAQLISEKSTDDDDDLNDLLGMI